VESWRAETWNALQSVWSLLPDQAVSLNAVGRHTLDVDRALEHG
jgi:hypothetical protein